MLGGLSSRPELNGQRGVARSFEGGRYAVALEGGGESVRVRPGNLSPAAAERASSGAVAVSDEVVAAAERGEEEAVLAWLDGGGRADATYERGEVSGLTLLMGAARTATSGWSSCCCGAARRSTCRQRRRHRADVAAANGHERVVELLLRHGAEINLQRQRRRHRADGRRRQGHERVVDLLLQHGAEVNLQSSNGGTALMYAALFNHPAVVRRLLRAGADTAARTASGKTALQLAKEKGHAECVEVLLRRRRCRAEQGRAALLGRGSGSWTRRCSAASRLGGLSSRPELNGRGAWLGASRAGGTRWRSRAAARACGCGRVICRRRRRASSGGVAVSDEVVAAAERGEEEAVLAWLDGGGRVDATYERGGVSGLTLLMGAARYGHERVVELLLRHGAEINLQDSDGGTALMDAAAKATSGWSSC